MEVQQTALDGPRLWRGALLLLKELMMSTLLFTVVRNIEREKAFASAGYAEFFLPFKGLNASVSVVGG